MEKRTVLFGMLAATLLLGQGCRKDEPEAVDLGYGYFPRNVGAWIEYQVDSIARDDEFNVHDTVSYRLKEKVVETYTDPAGRQAWRIHRYILNADSEWVVRDVWTSTKDAFYAEVSEENNRRLKLSFPVRAGRTWDVNIYNTEEGLLVAHQEVGMAYSVNGLSFPSTTLVKSTTAPNFIETITFQERYADGIGLVWKGTQDTETQPQTVNGATVYYTRGTYFTMSAVAYGTE